MKPQICQGIWSPDLKPGPSENKLMNTEFQSAVAIVIKSGSKSAYCSQHHQIRSHYKPIILFRIISQKQLLMKPFVPSYSDLKYKRVQNIITIIEATVKHLSVCLLQLKK